VQYERIPLVVEAWQVRHDAPVPIWLVRALLQGHVRLLPSGDFDISLPKGVQRADEGDWIILGINGVIYQCEDAAFTQLYQLHKAE